jgi:hypothetical protein
MLRRLSTPALLALALLVPPGAATAAPADESLALQPSSTSTVAGGNIELKVLGRLFPSGKAVVALRAADLDVGANGGGSVSPATTDPGETRWIYRAPDAVVADLSVNVWARVKGYPDAVGSCTIKVSAPPKPVTPAAPAPADDDEGDEVEGGAQAADAVGKLCTLVRWRARSGEAEEWNEKKLPARGEELTAPGLQQQIRFRVNAAKAKSIEVHWWRNDRPQKVRKFTERNRHLSLETDQDGFAHGTFQKALAQMKGVYTFALVVTDADGKVQRENVVLRREKPKEEEKGKDAGGKGGGKK